jgi:DNA-binding transcriptional ArsR family regulator
MESARVFRALADPTRRQILQELRQGELAAGDIASRFHISAPSVSRHLSLLEVAGLISPRRDGNRIFYRLEVAKLTSCLNGFLSAVCPEQILTRRRMGKSKTEKKKEKKS